MSTALISLIDQHPFGHPYVDFNFRVEVQVDYDIAHKSLDEITEYDEQAQVFAFYDKLLLVTIHSLDLVSCVDIKGRSGLTKSLPCSYETLVRGSARELATRWLTENENVV